MITLLPYWCFSCRRYISDSLRSHSSFLCCRCHDSLPLIQQPICSHCGLDHVSEVCKESWAADIDTFHAIFYYRDPVHHWIINHKYSGGFFAGRILREFVKSWFQENRDSLENLDVVLPVPIHPRRLRQRGFNQTSFLVKSQTVLPMKTNWLKKRYHTSPQAGLSGKERRKNIQGAFYVSESVRSKNVLIFDDVCTTGQTLGEICDCLKAVDVGRIQVLTLSRST